MISVCVATYNGEKYIYKQLESILNQLGNNDELIISDDNSTDNTLSIIKGLRDHRIMIIENNHKHRNHRYSKSHYWVTKNFENALNHCTGDYIFLSDQDDIWLPDKISKVIVYLKQNYFVMTNYSYIDKDGHIIKERVFTTSPISKNYVVNLINLPYHGCCLAFPSSLLNVALPFPQNLIMHDAWLGLIAGKYKYNIKFIDEPLTFYRRHESNVSPSKSSNPLLFKIIYRLKLLFQVINR